MQTFLPRACFITGLLVIAGCAAEAGTAGGGSGEKAGSLASLQGLYARSTARPGELVGVVFDNGGTFRALRVQGCFGASFGTCRFQSIAGTYSITGTQNQSLKLEAQGGQQVFQGTGNLVGGVLTLRSPDASGPRPRIRPLTLFARATPGADAAWITKVKAEFARLESTQELSTMQETSVRQLPRAAEIAFHAMQSRSDVEPQAWQITVENRKVIIVQVLDDETEVLLYDTTGRHLARGTAEDAAVDWDGEQYLALEAGTAYLSMLTQNGNGSSVRTAEQLPQRVRAEVNAWNSEQATIVVSEVNVREITVLGQPVFALDIKGTDPNGGAALRWVALWTADAYLASGEWQGDRLVWD